MTSLVAANDPQRQSILDSTFGLWNEGLSRQAYGRFDTAELATPWGRRHVRRLALVDDGAVMASAKLYTFQARLDERPVHVAGVGAMFTETVHRGKGTATELLERLLERAAAEGADLALLFSTCASDRCSRLGFEPIPLFDLALEVFPLTRGGAPGTQVRAGEERDLPLLADMDARRPAPYRFALVRDRELIHYAIARKRLLSGLGPSGARELHFFSAEEGGNCVAAVVMVVRPGDAVQDWTIEFAADRDPTGARCGAILQALIARDPGAPRPRISAWFPPLFQPPQIDIVRHTPSRTVMMIRPLSEQGRAMRPLSSEDVCCWKGDVF